METGIRRARDIRFALSALLALSMAANLALSVGLANREASTVLVPAVSGPVWKSAAGAPARGISRTWRAPRR